MPYYYPQNYQQNYPQNYQQMPQIQNGGIVIGVSEEYARKYPVAPGCSVTFIDENGTHCYTKTAGFSQFEAPKFEKYRLIKENEPNLNDSGKGDIDIPPTPEYALKSDFDKLKAEFKKFKSKVEKDDE